MRTWFDATVCLHDRALSISIPSLREVCMFQEAKASETHPPPANIIVMTMFPTMVTHHCSMLFALFLTQNINKNKNEVIIKMFAEVDEFLCFAS